MAQKGEWDDTEAQDEEALTKLLGDDEDKTSSTMPVTDPVREATDETSSTMPVTDPVRADAPPATTGGGAPWSKGQIMGGAREGADFGRLAGGFGAADTDSMKHTFGRIAQNFAHTPEGLNALVQDEEFKRLFPNATVSKDWIDFHGQVDPHTGTKVGKIDVQRAWDPSNNTGTGWQWLTEEEALGNAGGGAAGGAGGVDLGPLTQLAGATGGAQGEAPESALQKIIAEIQALSEGGSQIDQDALMQLLGGGA